MALHCCQLFVNLSTCQLFRQVRTLLKLRSMFDLFSLPNLLLVYISARYLTIAGGALLRCETILVIDG